MHNTVNNAIENYLFLIADVSKERFLGAGFLVQAPEALYIVTATHVIADVLNIARDDLRASATGDLNVYFPKTGHWSIARLTSKLSPSDADDVATLTITDLPTESTPATLAESIHLKNAQFLTAGAREAGFRASGYVLGWELVPRNPLRHVRIELSSRQIDGGMSGSPIVHQQSGLVVGMIVATWYSLNAKDDDTSYGATSETIAALLPGLQLLDIDAIDYELRCLAEKMVQAYEGPTQRVRSLFGLNPGFYIDMPLWKYGVEYVDETTVQFSWLSKEAKEAERSKGMLSQSAIAFLLNWVDRPESPYMALLAEFGMGKSTLLYRLEYLLAKEYLIGGENFPLRISLGHKHQSANECFSLTVRVRDFIEDTYKVSLSLGKLDEFIQNGRAVLLLDSFDEMSMTVTPNIQVSNLHQILGDVKDLNNVKLLIASRDNYFLASTDIQETFKSADPFFPIQEFEIAYLRGFSPKEIQLYLQEILGERAQGFWGEIEHIHDLPDLARRPILLTMMIILENELLERKIKTRTQLYREFVRAWLKRERINKRVTLPDEKIMRILDLLSEEVSLEPGRTFPQGKIDNLLMEEFGYSVSEAENYGCDFKVCCFLGRDAADNYKFLHSSFREYFFANRLLYYINERDWSIFSRTFISKEVIDFLIDLVPNSLDIIHILESTIATERGSDYLLTNAMAMYERLVQNQPTIDSFYESLLTNRSEPPPDISPDALPENFALIPAGTFLMGSWRGRPDEVPIHVVTVQRFALSRYPITNQEFQEFVNDSGYVSLAEKVGGGKIWTGGKWRYVEGANWKNPRGDGIDLAKRLSHPVVQIALQDAVAYCKWITKKLGRTIELPSESEWEYACRARSLNEWCFGSDESFLTDYAWYLGNLKRETFTQPVGQKRPNAWGLFDMHGNVREWCSDIYERYPGNNLQWDLGERYFSVTGVPHYILRGGHFASTARFLRSAMRVSGRFDLSTDYTGFRTKLRLEHKAISE